MMWWPGNGWWGRSADAPVEGDLLGRPHLDRHVVCDAVHPGSGGDRLAPKTTLEERFPAARSPRRNSRRAAACSIGQGELPSTPENCWPA